MNGTELPCGSVLKVQPADSSYNQERFDLYKSPQLRMAESEPIDHPAKPVDNDNNDNTNDDDLDDFFSSL